MLNYHNYYFAKLKKLPFKLLLIISLLCIYGFAILYSAAGGNIHPWAYKQIIHFIIFLPIAILIALIDIRIIFKLAYIFYFIVFLMLIFVELFGISGMGAKRWLSFGFMTLQPSEPAKLAIVLMLAKYFHQAKKEDLSKIKTLIVPIIGVILPVLLIIKQPDLGTGVITLIVAAIMFFSASVKITYFIFVGGISIISMPIIWTLLHEYQKKRILTFLDPAMDPLGAGYNVIQSKISIGSGGFWGKGFLKGTQAHLDFLPEHQTDFIFSSLAEELGFFGAIYLIILYAILIITCTQLAIRAKNVFSRLTIIGISSIFFANIFINIAMVMGLLPAVGVPLPFISHGGTMMTSMLIGFGIIMNCSINSNNKVFI